MRTILDEDVKTLFDQKGGIEDDQAVTERQDVITCTGFEELANSSLQTMVRRELTSKVWRLTRPSSCSWSRGLMGPLDFEPWARSRGRR